ncbi:MAG: hypothetical protein HGA67_02575 [Candidatus Yonathbacteria bacterium]|nr:hypothetical protein [Candidatus Yonathbacteria bacterium]
MKRLPLTGIRVTERPIQGVNPYEFAILKYFIETKSGRIIDILDHFHNEYPEETVLHTINRHSILGNIRTRGVDCSGTQTWKILKGGEFEYYTLCEPTWSDIIRSFILRHIFGIKLSI